MRSARRHRRLRLRLALLAAVAVVSSATALALLDADAFSRLELDTVDMRYSVRGDREPRRDIVIVALDPRTYEEVQADATGAIPRSLHARLVRRLHSSGAKLIAYDSTFTGRKDARGDRALLRAMAEARPVLVAATVARPKVAGRADTNRLGLRFGDPKGLTDEDGLIRRMPYWREPPQAFPVVAAELSQGRPVDAGRFDETDAGDGAAWIDYSGPPGHIPQYSFSRVVSGRVPASRFKGKVVLVGGTDPLFKDIAATPTSADPMPGVEIQANSVATILGGFSLGEPSDTLRILLTLAMALVAPLVAMRLSAVVTLAGALLAGAVFVVGTQLAFNSGSIVPFTYPLLGLVMGTVGATGTDLLLETRDRRRLRQTFARFVPEHVVTAVLERTDDDLRLGGEMLDATVLFCDLRGFTRFSERQPASAVIETLNRYLTEMSDAILTHRGTVVSYMGDGVMAVFGAPLEQQDNAERAFAAAREMVERRLPDFNAWLEERGMGEAFRMGIGLSTGPVMSGNVGSARRLEYTAVGDTTNLAARLQVMNKEHGSQLLMTESTRLRLPVEDSELVYIGEEAIPGRRGTVKVWGVAAPSAAAPRAAEAPDGVDAAPRGR